MPREGSPTFHLADLDNGVGQRVRDARARRGLSRKALAQRSGVSGSTIAHVERGDQKPLPDTLRRLAAALELPFHVLAPSWEEAEMHRPKSGYEHPGLGLRAIRLSQNRTLKELADATGVSISTISRFERGLHATREFTSQMVAGASHNDQIGIVNADLAKELGFASAAALTRACAAIEDV